MAKKQRMPREIIEQISDLIRVDALRIEKEQGADYVTTDSVSEGISAQIQVLLAPYNKLTNDDWVRRHIPQVLGEDFDKDKSKHTGVYQPPLPNLLLPLYLSVPPTTKDSNGEKSFPERWKRPMRMTPNELKLVEAVRERDIQGRITHKEAITVLRETAESRGCSPDQEIGPVFRDDDDDPFAGLFLEPRL